MKKNRGQIWIETVLYSLIGLALIGIVLAFAMPKITDLRDRIVVEQSITALNELDEKVSAVLQAPGNRRPIDFNLKRGVLIINSTSEEIFLIISDLRRPYSEPGVEVELTRVKINSTEGQKYSTAYLRLDYKSRNGQPYINLTYNGKDENKQFDSASLPYKIFIENFGGTPLDKVDIREGS